MALAAMGVWEEGGRGANTPLLQPSAPAEFQGHPVTSTAQVGAHSDTHRAGLGQAGVGRLWAWF